MKRTLIQLSVNTPYDVKAQTAPILRRLTDKMARAVPDPDGTATKAYVTIRRFTTKWVEDGPQFEQVVSVPAANHTIRELEVYLTEIRKQKYPVLVDLLRDLRVARDTRQQEAHEHRVEESRRAARGSAKTVREARGVRRQGE